MNAEAPKTPRVHGFCDAPVERQVGKHRMTAYCDLPHGHTGAHQALLDGPVAPKGAA